MPSNQAAYLTRPKTLHPLEVKPAPYTKPEANEVVVKVHAVAINPVDWLKAGKGYSIIFPWMKLPAIQGSDLAGEVVEIGSGVSQNRLEVGSEVPHSRLKVGSEMSHNRLKVGDRVLSHAMGYSKQFNSAARGAFQLYTVCLDHMTSQIPDSMSYEEAAVIPLAVTTAACSLFQNDQLNLQRPSIPRQPTNKTVLIWGGSTSVGCNAIQLAVAAGYEVVTTCSPKNFDLCKRLGAQECFDYNSKTVVPDVIKKLEQTDFAGAMSAGINSDGPCFDIVSKCKSGKVVSMVSFPKLEPEPTTLFLPRTILFFLSWFIGTTMKSTLRGFAWKLVNVDQVVNNGIGKAIYTEFLPKALLEKSYVAAPEPEIVGNGLESIQEGYLRQEKGMSAKKVVVSLQT